jgi:hypothetical protein
VCSSSVHSCSSEAPKLVAVTTFHSTYHLVQLNLPSSILVDSHDFRHLLARALFAGFRLCRSRVRKPPSNRRASAIPCTRNSLVLELVLFISDSFEFFHVRSRSCVSAMTLAQAPACHMLATSRFVATPPAPAVCYAKHSPTSRTLAATLGILTSPAPTVCYAKHSRPFRTLVTTLRILTSFTPTV